jgi:hypothetical protein
MYHDNIRFRVKNMHQWRDFAILAGWRKQIRAVLWWEGSPLKADGVFLKA